MPAKQLARNEVAMGGEITAAIARLHTGPGRLTTHCSVRTGYGAADLAGAA
jgi:hypothetical protein